MIDAVEKGEREVGHQQRLWYVRLLGEEKDVWTAYWTINQRMFRFETFVMPAPEENEQAFYEHLLMRNRELTGMNLEIGDEHAIFSLARCRSRRSTMRNSIGSSARCGPMSRRCSVLPCASASPADSAVSCFSYLFM